MFGVGLRHKHFPYFENGGKSKVDFFEIISENFMNTKGRPFEILIKLRQEYPVCMHGVSLSIAGTNNFSDEYLSKLKALEKTISPFVVSDHLCFTGVDGNNLHNLLPFSYTEKNLNRISDRIKFVQDYLNRQMIFENLSAYFTLKDSEMSESEFLNEICERTGCGILLDVNNLYVNSVNQNFDPTMWLSKINFSNVKQLHLAGFTDYGDYLFDTHSNPVHQDVWKLYRGIIQDNKNIPVLIEWDEDIPDFEILEEEALKAKNYAIEI